MSFVEGSLSVGIELAPGTLDRLKAQLTNLEKGVALKVSIDPKPLQQASGATEQLSRSVNNAAASLSNKLGGAVKAAGVALGSLAAVGGAGLVAISTKAILAGKEFNILQQQVRAGLTAILGTSKAAEDLLKNVNKLNDTSPFPRSSFLAATQQLVGFGVQADKVLPIIDAVQNAVAGIGGDANDIARFTRAFAQIQSQGRLTGDVLFTLGEKGIDAAAIIGKQMGKTGQDIKSEVTAGTLGAEKAIDALAKGLTVKFDGAVANVAKSFLGASDRVTARLRDIGADITKAFINPLGGGAAVEGLNNIANGLSNVRKNVISQLLPVIQQAANLFVKATQAFASFAASIKTDQVQKFLQIFQTLLPLIAVFGTRLVASITSGLPLIGRLTGALGGPLAAIALIIATVPELRSAFLDLISALTPLVQALLPVFRDTLATIHGIFISLLPLLTVVVGVIKAFASVVTPLVNALQGLGFIAPILTLLILKFGLAKLAGTEAFLAISIQATAFKAQMIAAGLTTGTFGQRFTSLKALGTAALSSLQNGFKALASPEGLISLAVIGITFLISEIEKAKNKARELAATATTGLNLNDTKDQALGIAEVNRRLTEQQAIVKKTKPNLLKQILTSDPQTAFADLKKNEAAKEQVKILQQQAKVIEEIQEKQRSLGAGVLQAIEGTDLAKRFSNITDVVNFATESGVDFNNLRFDQIIDSTADLVKKMKELPVPIDAAGKKLEALKLHADAFDKVRAAADQLKASEKALADLRKITAQQLRDDITQAELGLEAARRGVGAAADNLLKSEISLDQARRGVGQAQEHLNDLEKKRAELLADTGREAREVADANAALERTNAELIDQAEREQELRDDLTRLGTEGPDKLAAADRAIERAKIALNNATREEKELQDEANKSHVTAADLAGLSVSQIKTKLAGVRAELAAQRASKGTLKTQQQIDDEAKSITLNRQDAEQALKDAIQSRADLENAQNIQRREDEEALKALAIDHESSLRRQFEQQQELSKLRSGDTTTAQTLKDLNDQITGATDTLHTSVIAVRDAEREVASAKDAQVASAITIRDAELAVRDAKDKQRQHTEDIKTAQQKVKEDAIEYKNQTALAMGDQATINKLLVDRIGLNSTIIKQNPLLIQKLAEDLLGPALTSGGPGAAGASLRAGRISKLTDILTNHPDQLLGFLRDLGLPLAEGAVINRETFARIGEAGREVVLPLTRPARLAELLAHNQVLPPVLAALGRITLPAPQSKGGGHSGGDILTPSLPGVIKPLSVPTGSNAVVRRADGPMTYGQAEDIINLLRENGKSELRVEAPVTINTSIDEDVLIRKLTSKIERRIYEILSRR